MDIDTKKEEKIMRTSVSTLTTFSRREKEFAQQQEQSTQMSIPQTCHDISMTPICKKTPLEYFLFKPAIKVQIVCETIPSLTKYYFNA